MLMHMKKAYNFRIDMKNLEGLQLLAQGKPTISWNINKAIREYLNKNLSHDQIKGLFKDQAN